MFDSLNLIHQNSNSTDKATVQQKSTNFHILTFSPAAVFETSSVDLLASSGRKLRD